MSFPRPESSVLVIVDLQERLLPVVVEPDAVIARSRILLEGALALGVDVLVTEQYPKGLGHTVPPIADLLSRNSETVEKTGFSAFAEPSFRTKLVATPKKTLIVAGIEAHICVLQTVLDALDDGFEVICVADAVSSRKPENRELALETMRRAGALILPTESVLFMLLRDAKNPIFKTISQLIR